ncbi:threonine aldolase family protein [Streptomyces luteolus]|uniref:Beta-eliminating lyase-related protein n=1 Tax=Streptomyces luteolus TaxID=3043615 RepID=A0ABT6SUV3_9ACTN|nr:beta-eliminating lyase-related protein [Streptomyces sp. B-S-A12]MDI3418422.1 beta-eliminating lyase-related protein [Streptomyces sp. B-S-A12]
MSDSGRDHTDEPDGPDGPDGPNQQEEPDEQGKPDEQDEPDDHGRAQSARERLRTALRGARRTLARPAIDATVGERLTRLAADAGEVYDLGEPADMYGNGVVAELEVRVAELLGAEEAAFFPTGTMAQQVALRCWAGRTGNATVALHPLSHPEQHERGAFPVVSGLRTVHPTSEPRLPTAEEVRDLDEPFGALMLELPLREAGFALPSWEELVEVVEAARERDAVVHFDGARLWECTTHFGRPLEEIAQLADSVYVSFYKSLGGLGGAALVGPGSFVAEARAWRHRYGGQVFQQFPTALSALLGLTRELPHLPSYVAHARVVADALRAGFVEAGVPWFRVHPEVPHTHQFQVWLPYAPDVLTNAAAEQAEETGNALFRPWFREGPPGLAVTEVTVAGPGLEWTAEDVRKGVRDFVRRL